MILFNNFRKINFKNTHKNIFLFIIIIISSFTISACSSNTSSTNNTNLEQKEKSKPQELIFDAKQLIGANKDIVDKMLNQIGTQNTSEPYVYNYGESSAAFDDNGICLNLYLDTTDKEYKSYDEDEILKKYGIDLKDSYYKGDSSIGKHYTKIKNFNELDIWYDNNYNIRTISFYPKGIQKLNNFLDTKSKNNSSKTSKTENMSDNSNSSYNNATSGYYKALRSIKLKYDTNYSQDYFNDFDSLLNAVYTDLKNNTAKSTFTKIEQQEIEWIKYKDQKKDLKDKIYDTEMRIKDLLYMMDNFEKFDVVNDYTPYFKR